jgi:hypothetical protein
MNLDDYQRAALRTINTALSDTIGSRRQRRTR